MKQLKRLWVSGMCAKKMTAAERQELQDALPDTQIMFEGEPTDNGWREDPVTKEQHPHYRVVYEIFHTGVYIPFEDSVPPPAADGQDGETPDQRFMVEEDMDAEDLFGGDAG